MNKSNWQKGFELGLAVGFTMGAIVCLVFIVTNPLNV